MGQFKGRPCKRALPTQQTFSACGVLPWGSVAAVETTPAILLRKIKLTESSLILTWLTEAHGLLKTVAKGARQPKSRFAGLLDLFFDCEIEWVRSRRSELHILREVIVKNPHQGLRLEYPRVALGAYFVELLELATEPEHPAPEIYELLQRALGYLNTHPASKRALLHFESELTRLLGIAEPGVSAASSLDRLYHRLPGARPELLKTLA
jgi:DNA repair protein RecO (recombination protein O)